MDFNQIQKLVQPADSKILLVVLDGLGGLPKEPAYGTALEAAETPNLDDLARQGICGLHQPVGTGITPGSGSAHLAIFNYDPLRYQVGRGVLAALGINFDLKAEAEQIVSLIHRFLKQARSILSDRHPANMLLLRGFSKRPDWPQMKDVYGIRAAAIRLIRNRHLCVKRN